MPLKSIHCECGAGFDAADEDELVHGAQRHAREVHRMELTREQVLAMAQPIEPPAARRGRRARKDRR